MPNFVECLMTNQPNTTQEAINVYIAARIMAQDAATSGSEAEAHAKTNEKQIVGVFNESDIQTHVDPCLIEMIKDIPLADNKVFKGILESLERWQATPDDVKGCEIPEPILTDMTEQQKKTDPEFTWEKDGDQPMILMCGHIWTRFKDLIMAEREKQQKDLLIKACMAYKNDLDKEIQHILGRARSAAIEKNPERYDELMNKDINQNEIFPDFDKLLGENKTACIAKDKFMVMDLLVYTLNDDSNPKPIAKQLIDFHEAYKNNCSTLHIRRDSKFVKVLKAVLYVFVVCVTAGTASPLCSTFFGTKGERATQGMKKYLPDSLDIPKLRKVK